MNIDKVSILQEGKKVLELMEMILQNINVTDMNQLNTQKSYNGKMF